MQKDIKRKLERYRKLMEMAKELQKQADELENRAEAVGSKRITDMPRSELPRNRYALQEVTAIY